MFHKLKKKIMKLMFRIMPNCKLRIQILRKAGYIIGKNVYLPSDLLISDLINRRCNLILGDRVSIGPRVTLITDSSPNFSRLLKKYPINSGNIIINNDAWIGAGAIILPGVTIGEFSIIGSGAVVTRDIPPFSIATGIPAKVIKKISKNGL